MNLSSLQELKKTLAQFSARPKKSFAQHFLVDEAVLLKIENASDIQRNDVVIEIGAGPGVLSQRLAKKAQKLIALEIDQTMIPIWKSAMKNFSNAEIFEQDALTFVPPNEPYKVIANIPYYITSPLLKHFLRNQSMKRPELIVFLIQEDVAKRICDEKKPSLLSWEVRIFGKPEIICRVPSTSFFPQPKISSAVLKISLFRTPLIEKRFLTPFFHSLGTSYKQPRKTLLNNLLASGKWRRDDIQKIFLNIKLNLKTRPHQVTLQDLKKLFLPVTRNT